MNLNAEYCKYKYEDKKYTQKNRKCFFKKKKSPHCAHCSNLSCVRPVFMTFHSLSLNETSSARQISRVAKVKACC